MVDRTDIDALLIGALYGELTPADEARLTAHLASHPADRTALEDLTHTRDAVRASGLHHIWLEPPQAVSARVLQEAARAPSRRASTRRGFSASCAR
jgi:anti-sigma factor RsiW